MMVVAWAALLVWVSLSAAWAAEPAGTVKININRASVEELTELEGVGPGYAQKIVQYREEQGNFEKPEDIMKVKGVGQKIWEANKDRMTTD